MMVNIALVILRIIIIISSSNSLTAVLQ